MRGPPPWNHFYADARHAVHDADFTETAFADDLNCFGPFPTILSDEAQLESMSECQVAVHKWGEANQVIFDPAKESFHILHPVLNFVDTFRLLGVTLDAQLSRWTVQLARWPRKLVAAYP